MKKKSGFGLIEVLVTIAISSILILGAMSVAARSLRTVRSFELRDTASGILLRSQELARSPLDIQLRDIVAQTKSGADPQVGESFDFVLEVSPDQEQTFALQNTNPPSTQSLKIEDCSESSAFQLEVVTGVSICNQIIVSVEEITTTQESKEYLFKITSVIAYEFDNTVVTDELVSFRREFVSL